MYLTYQLLTVPNYIPNYLPNFVPNYVPNLSVTLRT